MSRADVVNRIRSVLMQTMHQQGQESVDRIKKSIGTQYPPASSPGEPPHKRTGGLQNSVGYNVTVAGPSANLEVTATAPYAAYLEYGTENMAARPFLRPEVDRIRQTLPQHVRNNLRQARF
jgi:HK97 gp10 family phage protein